MANDVIIEGEVDFKRGIMSRWKNVFCVLYAKTFIVYDSKKCENELHVFSPEQSWISAANKVDSGLFVLNIRPRRAASVKSLELFLFDTKQHDILRQWIKGLQEAGWKSAALGDKLRYHQRSLDQLDDKETNKCNVKRNSESKGSTELKMARNKEKLSVDIQFDDTNNNIVINNSRHVSGLKNGLTRLIPEGSIEFNKGNNEPYNDFQNARSKTNDQTEGQHPLYDSKSTTQDYIASMETCTEALGRQPCSDNCKCFSENQSLHRCKDFIESLTNETDVCYCPETNIGFPEINIDNYESDVKPSGLECTTATTDKLTELIFSDFGIDSKKCDRSVVDTNTSQKTFSYASYNQIDLITKESSNSDLINTTLKPDVTSQLDENNTELEDALQLSEHVKDCVSVESGYCSKESLSIFEESRLSSNSECPDLVSLHSSGFCDKIEVKQSISKKLMHSFASKEDDSYEGKSVTQSITSSFNSESVSDKLPARDRMQEITYPDRTNSRQTVSGIFAQFKNKISLRKQKGQKKSDRQPSKIQFSTKLLWNNGIEWKDRWFKLIEHTLFCYKDSAMKLLEFSVNINMCTISRPDGEDMQGLNIFMLTGPENKTYRLAAWSEQQLQSWLKALQRFTETNGPVFEHGEEDDSIEAIIPYSDAIEASIQEAILAEAIKKNEQQPTFNKGTGSQNEQHLQSQGSMDSGNDGDESESGLESSGASLAEIKQFANRKRHQYNRRKMGMGHTETNSNGSSQENSILKKLTSGNNTSEVHANENKSMECELIQKQDINISLTKRDLLPAVAPLERSGDSLQDNETPNLLETKKTIGPSYDSQSSIQVLKTTRNRQASLESSLSTDLDTSSVGSPTERGMFIDCYDQFHSPAILNSRKCSVDSCTSADSESESISSRKNTELRIDLRQVEKYRNYAINKGKTKTVYDDNPRRILLAEVLRQRETASKSLLQKNREVEDRVESSSITKHVPSATRRPLTTSKSVPLKRVTSQGQLYTSQKWEVNIENISQVKEEDDIIQLHPLSPNTVKENFSPVLTNVSPVIVDTSINEGWRMTSSVGSEESDDFLAYFMHDSQIELEKTVRNETLLKKRRNSLSLTKDSVLKELQTLQEKLNNEKEVAEQSGYEECVCSLQKQLDDINKELDDIENKLYLQHGNVCDTVKSKKTIGKRATAVLSRLRHPLATRNVASSNAKIVTDGSQSRKESVFKFRKRSCSSILPINLDSASDVPLKERARRMKKFSTSSEPHRDSSISSIGSSVDLRNVEENSVDGLHVSQGLKCRSKSVGNILQLGSLGCNGLQTSSTLQTSKTRQRRISRDALSKIEDFMEFSREMVGELTSRKGSDGIPDIIDV